MKFFTVIAIAFLVASVNCETTQRPSDTPTTMLRPTNGTKPTEDMGSIEKPTNGTKPTEDMGSIEKPTNGTKPTEDMGSIEKPTNGTKPTDGPEGAIEEPTNGTGELNLQLNVAMKIENLAFQQPYRNLCVALNRIQLDEKPVENEQQNEQRERCADDNTCERIMWTINEEASDGLSSFAQGGDCVAIKDEIKEKRPNAIFPDIGEMESSTLERSQWINFTVPMTISEEELMENENDKGFSLPFVFISFISQLANTNDGYVGLQSFPLRVPIIPKVPSLRRMVLVGYDAGVEENTQLCKDMDAPGCDGESQNENAQPGEGVVHVHRGYHTVQLSPEQAEEEFLDENIYDFRNPVGKVIFLTSWSMTDEAEEQT